MKAAQCKDSFVLFLFIMLKQQNGIQKAGPVPDRSRRRNGSTQDYSCFAPAFSFRVFMTFFSS